jgi:hypothetical protein
MLTPSTNPGVARDEGNSYNEAKASILDRDMRTAGVSGRQPGREGEGRAYYYGATPQQTG